MDKTRKISSYLMIVIAFGFSVYFFVSPFLGSPDQSLIPGLNQNPDSVSTLTDDVDVCVANPTSDCDQEFLQIIKFCKDNSDKPIPVCSDSRVQQYVDQRGLQRPVVNMGK
jgi:hypothetical protein